MKIPLSWISLYSPVQTLIEQYGIKKLAHEYSIHTAEIDGIEEHFLDKVVVGKVLSCEKHPDSKKLSIVRVNLGEHGEETILTGAANIIDATYVAVAIVGAVLPGDFVIGERIMAGMMSRGMICGADEIGMSTEESTGIMILEQDWDMAVLESMLGKSFFDLTLPFVGNNDEIYHYTLRDTTFEIDNKFITNRPDLFSVVGNAREFHAVFETPFRSYGSKNVASGTLEAKIETPAVSAYHLMKMSNITVEKSPMGMALMMERAGLAPKMDIVDITNCIMTELGQPMHAFDADKITGTITVRMANNGEILEALNGVNYTLTENDMIIADEVGPIALAGVIGGMASAVSLETKNIIWESACFDATTVRLTAQRHAIRTDASTRYEKSLDPLLAGMTFSRVLEYMNFLGKNTNPEGVFRYVNDEKINHISIDVPFAFINTKAGVVIPPESVLAILERLDFQIETGDAIGFRVIVPSHRASKDINIKEDIAEEIMRVYGYDNIPMSFLQTDFRISDKNHEIALRDETLRFFRDHHWHEVYNYSFSSVLIEAKLLQEDVSDMVGIQNAFNEEYTHMRRSLAPRLFSNIAENTKYESTLSFFEIGKVYSKQPIGTLLNSFLEGQDKKPFGEKKMLAGVTTSGDFETLRRTLESYFRKTISYVPKVHAEYAHSFLHPGASGVYRIGDEVVARFGKVHPSVATAFEMPENTLYFEIEYELILEKMNDAETLFHPISRFQTVSRELNFVLPETTPTGDIATIIDTVHPWISHVIVDSIYQDSERVGEGKKSVNFSFILSNQDGTISDNEALEVQNLVIETMKQHGYLLRGE